MQNAYFPPSLPDGQCHIAAPTGRDDAVGGGDGFRVGAPSCFWRVALDVGHRDHVREGARVAERERALLVAAELADHGRAVEIGFPLLRDRVVHEAERRDAVLVAHELVHEVLGARASDRREAIEDAVGALEAMADSLERVGLRREGRRVQRDEQVDRHQGEDRDEEADWIEAVDHGTASPSY